MTEITQLQTEEINHQTPPAEDEGRGYPPSHGRDWLLGFLVFALLLTLAALVLLSLGLLAAFLLGYNLQSLQLSSLFVLPPLAGTLNLLQSALILLAGLFVLAVVLYLLARWRVVRKHYLWPEAGCPSCRHETLVRVRRQPKDRLYAWIGIPVGRYHCRECRWNGLRIRRGMVAARKSEDWSEAVAAVRAGGSAARTSRQHPQDPRTVAASDEAKAKWAARLDDSAASAAALAVDEPAPAADTDQATPPAESQATPPNGVPAAAPSSAAPPQYGEAGYERESTGERPTPQAADWGEIASPFGLNLRSDPQSDAALVGLLEPGTNVRLLEKTTARDGSAWQHVQVDDRQGWVLSAFLKHNG